jgi:hypothetical protein
VPPAVAELVGRLGVINALDDAVGSIKQRDRGLSAGQFLVAVAQAQMFGAEFWTGLDRRRADTAGEALSAVSMPASTTAVELAQRFGPAQLAGIEEGIGEIVCRVVGGLPVVRRQVLRAGGATIDLDGTDVEVYGAAKEGIAYSYKGARAGRPHLATWEAGVTAADLLAGDEDPRPGAGVTARPKSAAMWATSPRTSPGRQSRPTAASPSASPATPQSGEPPPRSRTARGAKPNG